MPSDEPLEEELGGAEEEVGAEPDHAVPHQLLHLPLPWLRLQQYRVPAGICDYFCDLVPRGAAPPGEPGVVGVEQRHRLADGLPQGGHGGQRLGFREEEGPAVHGVRAARLGAGGAQRRQLARQGGGRHPGALQLLQGGGGARQDGGEEARQDGGARQEVWW